MEKQSPLLIIFDGDVHWAWAPRLTFDSDFRSHLKRASAYLCSMWLPALSCFSNTVNGSSSLARLVWVWSCSCKRAVPTTGLTAERIPLLSVLPTFTLEDHCNANALWCSCKERLGSLCIFCTLCGIAWKSAVHTVVAFTPIYLFGVNQGKKIQCLPFLVLCSNRHFPTTVSFTFNEEMPQ